MLDHRNVLFGTKAKFKSITQSNLKLFLFHLNNVKKLSKTVKYWIEKFAYFFLRYLGWHSKDIFYKFAFLEVGRIVGFTMK